VYILFGGLSMVLDVVLGVFYKDNSPAKINLLILGRNSKKLKIFVKR
jgi:hypothetical protein